ncbi:MAG: hypothetical protein IKO61_08870 [Lachnospiraceae bacterium]|nr:hypothetical protein [Lachnospiraceae bacterium]
MKKRTLKRLIAILLVLLMVTTLVENVSYRPIADDSGAEVAILTGEEAEVLLDSANVDIYKQDAMASGTDAVYEAMAYDTADDVADDAIDGVADYISEEFEAFEGDAINTPGTEQENASENEETPESDDALTDGEENHVSDGETVNDITGFLKGVNIYNDETEIPVVWEVDSDKSYRMHVNFSETASSSTAQFIMDDGKRGFSYSLPVGVNVVNSYSPLKITISDTSGEHSFTGTTYEAQQVGDQWVITGLFENNEMIKNANDVRFYLDFDVTFDEGIDHLDFGNEKNYQIVVDSSSHVSSEKTSSVDIANGKVNYTVTVNSTRTNNNVKIHDAISGTALSFAGITSITSSKTGAVSATPSTSATGFDLTIPQMTNGEVITINYSADIDFSKITNNGTIEQTGNTVTVKSDEDPEGDEDDTSETGKVTVGGVTKTASVGAVDEDGKQIVNYTITYNADAIMPANGTTLTDTLFQYSNGISYPSDTKLSVTKYNKSGQQVGSTMSVTPTTLADKQWTLALTDTTPYKYVITYSAVVDTNIAKTKTGSSNKIDDGKGHTSEPWYEIGGKPGEEEEVKLTVTKSHGTVDVKNKTIDWTFTVAVPKGGLSNQTVIKDKLPAQYYSGAWYSDELNGNVTVSPNVNFSLNKTIDNGANAFELSFPGGIPNDTEADKVYTFTYRTTINQMLLDTVDVQNYNKQHTNQVTVTDGTKTGQASDTAIAQYPKVTKKSEKAGTDANGYPIYKFSVIMSGNEIPVTLTDTFDNHFKLETSGSYAPFVHVSGAGGEMWGTSKSVPASAISASNGSFVMNMDESCFEKDSSGYKEYYTLEYYLTVKDAASYTDLINKAIANGYTYVMTNKAEIQGVEATSDYSFSYDPSTKTLTNSEKFINNAEVDASTDFPEFKIMVNEKGARLNDGKSYQIVDTFTNLAIDQPSITVTPSNKGVKWDMSGYKLTFTVPDETAFTITYKARISGKAGTTVTFKNDLNMLGSTDMVERTVKVSADSGGTGSVKYLRLLKHADGNLDATLNGAEFALYDKNKQPMTWKASSSKTGNVVVVTGADNDETDGPDGDGIAVISQSNIQLYETDEENENVYYLKEIKAPAGYMLDDTWYEFRLVSDFEPDYTKYQYVNGDVLRVKNHKPNIWFQKVDQDGKALKGAEFTLYDKNGKAVKTATSNDSGYVSMADIDVAAAPAETTFTLKETKAPSDNYALDTKDYTITYGYDASGNIVVKSSTIPSKFVNKDKDESASTELELEIKKTLDGSDALAGFENSFSFDIAEITAAQATALGSGTIPTGTSTLETAAYDEGNTYKATLEYKLNKDGTGDVGTHYYAVKENASGITGITDSKDVYLLEVQVAKDEDELVATKKSLKKISGGKAANASSMVFDNTTAPVKWKPVVTKYLYNETLEQNVSFEASSFKFSLIETTTGTKHGTDKDNQSSVAAGPCITPDAGATAEFAEITYTGADVGKTFTYKLFEDAVTDSQVTGDISEYTINVKITRNVDGSLKATPTIYKNVGTPGGSVPLSKIEFTNRRVEGEASFIPKAVKRLDGKSDLDNFWFNFKLESLSDTTITTAADAFNSKAWKEIDTAIAMDSGSVTFSQIDYSTAGNGEGTYFYRVTEIKNDEYTGFDYDEGAVIIRVDVIKEAETGSLNVLENYTYFDKNGNARAGSSVGEAYFNNTTKGDLKLVVNAKKQLDGATLAKDQFTFKITEPSGQNKLSSNPFTVKNTADGKVNFGQIAEFTIADLNSSFTFYVDEDRSNTAVSYDSKYYKIVVRPVRDLFTGELKLEKQIYEVEYEAGNYAADTKATKVFDTEDTMFNKESLIFTNSIIYSDLAIRPEAIKVLEDFGTGVNLSEDQFTFKFEQIDSDKSSAKRVSGGVNLTAKNDANGSVKFEPFTIKADDLVEGDNKLYYRMYETGEVAGFKGDDTVYVIYIVAYKANDGTVNVTVRYKKGYSGSYSSVYATMNTVSHVYEFTPSGNNELPFVFTNEVATGELKLQAVKKMKETGLLVKAGTFSFTAKRVDIAGGETVTESNKLIAAGQSGTVEFKFAQKFTAEDVTKTKTSPYVYEITEFAGDKTKFKFDDTKYKAYVTFDYDSDGNIVPTVTYKKVDGSVETAVSAAEFENSVVSSVSFKPQAMKTLVDENDKPVSLTNGMFTFVLATNEAFTENAETKVNDGEHVFFTEKTYDTESMGEDTEKTYTYYMKEVIPDPAQEGYEYDESVYRLTVKVTTDPATGELSLEKSIAKKAKGAAAYTDVDVIMPQFDNKIDSKEIKAWPINIRKNLSNNLLPPTQFKFKAVQVADAKGTAISGAEETVVTTSLETGIAQYDANLTKDEEYFFKIVELGGADPLVVYDTNEYIIKVSVDGEGQESTSIVNKNGTVLSAPEVYIGALPFNNSVSVKLAKLDEEGKVVEGATLKLTDNSGNAQTVTGALMSAGTWKSAKDAVSFEGVKVGEVYTLTEVSAPYGYKTADPVYFTVRVEDEKYVLYTGTSKSDINTAVNGATVSMTDKKRAIAIVKTDASGEILKGAHFKITTIAGKSVNTALDDLVVSALGFIPLQPIDYLKADQVYMLTETVAPIGFKLADKAVYFKIDANNVIYTGTSGDDLKRVDGDNITFVDTAGEFIIKKVDAAKTSTRVAGAELKITGEAGSITVNGSKTDSVTFTSTAGTDKTFKLDDFAAGTYTLTEETAPEGYEKAKPISFKITDDKKLLVDEDGSGSYNEAANVTITMKDTKVTTVNVRKVTAGTDNLLAGAVLAIRSADGKQIVDSGFVTNRSAAKEFMSSSFEKDVDYVLSEVSAPSGYTLTGETVTFKLDEAGVLWIKNGSTYKKQADNTITLENVAQIPVSKVAIAGGSELPGARLKIVDIYDEIVSGKDVNGKNVAYTWTSGTKPYMIDLCNFKPGETYRLVEITAPKGYDIAEDITFTIDTNGKVYVDTDRNGTFKAVTGLTMVDEASDVSFSKVDATDKDELPGAKLTITDEKGNTIKDSSGKALTWTSGTEPKVIAISSFEEGKLYKMTEITAPDGYEVAESIFFKVVRDEKGRYEVRAGKSADSLAKVDGKTVIMEDKPTDYKVTVSKVDITSEKEVAGAHLQIIENGKVITEWNSTTKAKEIKGLKPGVTYTLRETVAPEGYTITTDTTFTLKKDGSLDTTKTTASYKSTAKGKVKLLVKDDITSMHFAKYGYIRELCAENGTETKALKGAKFAAYEVKKDGTLGKAVAMATSNSIGEVIFDGIPKGHYAIKEVTAPEGYKVSDTVYYADVTDKAFAGLKDVDGNKVASNSVLNDFERGDIEFTKVSEMNKEKKLSDSTYELYREEDDGTETYVATAVSDKNGVVRFEGVKTKTKYKVKEVESPNGYYISKKPIEVIINVDENGVKKMELSNDGDGTIELDKNGNLTWLEPSVVVSFLKTDEEGNPLAGATLAVYNSRGELMKDAAGNDMLWNSGEAPVIVADVFNDGETYTLVELVAPDGYEVAEPVIFEIPAVSVGPKENRIVSVTMKDKRKPKDEKPDEKPEEEKPDDKKPSDDKKPETKPAEVTPNNKEPVTEAPKTGDNSPIKAVATAMLASLVGLVGFGLADKKRKKK